MDGVTKKRIRGVLDEVLSAPPEDEFVAARRALSTATSDVLIELAVAAVVDAVRRERRHGALHVEKAVTRTRRQIMAERDPAYQASLDEITARHRERLFEAMMLSAAQYADALRIEWTEELLGTEFALPDGSRTTWGDATVEQHEWRVAMFTDNARANIEGAARHRKAIEELRASGAPYLKAMVLTAAGQS